MHMGALTVARSKRVPREARESRLGVLTRGFTLPRASQRYWSAIKNRMLGLLDRGRTSRRVQLASCRRYPPESKPPPIFRSSRRVNPRPACTPSLTFFPSLSCPQVEAFAREYPLPHARRSRDSLGHWAM